LAEVVLTFAPHPNESKEWDAIAFDQCRRAVRKKLVEDLSEPAATSTDDLNAADLPSASWTTPAGCRIRHFVYERFVPHHTLVISRK
jgi:hypothetical protein